ncbi:MAG: replicative DNA helicase [Clostridiales bacterium]|nr:replicative DNA helicase [Clostridiales bacterium]
MPELNNEDLLYRQVPHSLEAEQSVLGSMLIDSRCIPQVMEALTKDDFYQKENVELFTTINKMFNLSQKIDAVTVLEQMRIDGYYQENTTRNYVLQLLDITPTAANVGEYIAIVQDKSLLRRIGDTAADITGMVQRNEGSAQDILEVAEQRIYDIRQGRASRGLIHISEAIDDVYTRLEELAASDRDIPGISTGLTDLDRQISGLNNSDLILLAARPGMGKTSLALNILLTAGKDTKKSVVYFSLEMSREQLAMRLLSNEALIDNKKLVTGNLEEQDWVDVANAASVLSQTNILIDDNPSLTVTDMLAKCRRVKDLGLVCVDYLQLMQSAGGKSYAGESRQQAVSDISRALKIMAKELNVPVLCLSQLSRANEGRQDKRPMLSDLRESGAIEQDADIVMFIYRDDYYNEDSDHKNEAELIVAKNRHGETGKVIVQWLPEFTTFSGRDTFHQER